MEIFLGVLFILAVGAGWVLIVYGGIRVVEALMSPKVNREPIMIYGSTEDAGEGSGYSIYEFANNEFTWVTWVNTKSMNYSSHGVEAGSAAEVMEMVQRDLAELRELAQREEADEHAQTP